MKLRLATPSVLVDVGRLDDLSYVARRGRPRRDRRAHRAITTSSTATCCASTCRCWRSRRVRWATRRFGTVARSADRSRTPTPRPTSRRVCSRCGGTIVAAWRRRRARDRGRRLLRGLPRDRARRPTRSSPRCACPRRPAPASAFQKFNRRAQDWAIVGVAAVGGERPGVALVNMGSTPLRAGAVEARARRRRRRPSRRPRSPTRAPSRPPTSTPARTTAGTWRACS